MHVVGLFRELTKDKTDLLPSIHEAKGRLNPQSAKDIALYLRSGVPVFDVMEATPDPLNPQVFIKGGPSLLSDGLWVWREDLAHYVERYQVDLPAPFVNHVKNAALSTLDDTAIVARWEEALAAYESAETNGYVER